MRKKRMKGVLAILISFYAVALFAPFIAPYPADREDRKMPYCPPHKLRVFDDKGICWPFVYKYSRVKDTEVKKYAEDKSQRLRLILLPKTKSYALLPFIRLNRKLFGWEGDGMVYLMGADKRGRDVFSRIIYGSRVSLSIGLLAAILTFFVGSIIGGIAGYFGGIIDEILMRLCEIVMLLPAFYIILALRAVFPLNYDPLKLYILILFLLSLLGWASIARVIRSMALHIAKRPFVKTAKALGASDIYIIARHILPHTASYVIIALMLSVPGYIVGESALSMIGLGIQEPYVSWGSLLAEAMDVNNLFLRPWLLWPGAFIASIVFVMNILSDKIRDAYDPYNAL